MGDPFSTAASIIDLLCKAKELHGKFKDVKDLPNAFQAITSQIDLASSIFEKVKNNASLVSQDQTVQDAIDSCRADAERLNAIYEVVSKDKHKNAVKRYWGYVKDVGQDRTGAVEKIWERLLHGACLLADRCGLEGLSELREAIVALQKLPSSLESTARPDTYNNFADNVGVQGHNSGKVIMGNSYEGNHIVNRGPGLIWTIIWKIQMGGLMLIALAFKASTDREKRLVEALQRSETLRPVCITAEIACVFQVRFAQAQLQIGASPSNSTKACVEPAAASGEVVQKHTLSEKTWILADARQLFVGSVASPPHSPTDGHPVQPETHGVDTWSDAEVPSWIDSGERLYDRLQHATKPPWTYSPTLGGQYVYSPRTDEIIMETGQRFPRPSGFPVDKLQLSSWDGPLSFQGPVLAPRLIGGSMPDRRQEHSQALPNIKDSTGPPGRLPGGAVAGKTQQSQGLRLIEKHRELQVWFSTWNHTSRRESPDKPERDASAVVIGNEEVISALFPQFTVQPARFFAVGRVFQVLWSEPAGGDPVVTKLEAGCCLNKLGERAFSKARHFVVVRQGNGLDCCHALPINSYGGQGVARRGVDGSQHCIIHTGRVPTQPVREELAFRVGQGGILRKPIMVDTGPSREQLDSDCRLNLAGVTMVQHGVKVREFGKVDERSLHDLLQQFHDVWGGRPFSQNPRLSFAGHRPELDAEEESDNDKDEGGKEESRDNYGTWWFE